ncbi:MAG: metallophosphoesterase [Verrucomicrobiaceae bacterium]|nr:metallophosphoesterase [Verrucomicrobiaceae bacterium]
MTTAQPETRRALLKRGLMGMMSFGAVGGGGAYSYARLIERKHPVVERLRLGLKGLGPAFEGFRIVQISDLHVEPHVNQPLLAKTVSMINDLKPDLVVITGDIITNRSGLTAKLTEPLADLKARVGVMASLGNHDVWHNPKVITTALQNHGIKVHRNTGEALGHQGDQLWIAGLDSVWAGSPRIADSLKGKAKTAPCVMLGHEPDYADTLSKTPGSFLHLAGHTHGGQICWPGGFPIKLPRYGLKYGRGLFEVGNVHLYVNRGIGTVMAKARFACSPEITEFTLESDPRV